MENEPQSQEFSIRPTIERTPFQDAPTRNLFNKWCEANDSITPSYVSRDEWDEQKKDGILQKHEGNKSTLLVPKDLHLWEMVAVIRAVDTDTFSKDSNEGQDLHTKLITLGETFTNAGVYVAQNLDAISEGKQIAQKTSRDLYRYGNALQTGDYKEQISTEDFANTNLTSEQVEAIDAWFGVDKLARFKKQDIDQTRKELLAQFFKVADRSDNNELYQRALDRSLGKYLDPQINRPEQELQDVILRRGAEKIVSEMGKDGWRDEIKESFKEIGIDLEGKEHTLREALEIPRLKLELALVREAGDIEKISEKEREVALSIQNAVSKIEFQSFVYRPSDIVRNQTINCVGASMTGTQLLKDVGITYLVVSYPEHSITTLITTDGKVYYQDFLQPNFNFEITEDSGYRNVMTGQSVKAEDLVAVKNNPSHEGLVMRRGKKQPISLLPPEKGIKSQIIGNLGAELVIAGANTEAITLLKYAQSLDINNCNPYSNLSAAYGNIGNYQMSYEYVKKALSLYPEDLGNNYWLGIVLERLDKRDEALKVFEMVMVLDHDSEEEEDDHSFADKAKREIDKLIN